MKINNGSLEYLVDFVENNKEKDWDVAVSHLGLNIHPDSLRKAFYTSEYCGYNVYKYMKDLDTNYYATDEEIERLEQKKDELYKERVKYQDIISEKRKMLREESRLEKIIEVIKEKTLLQENINFNPIDFKFKEDGNIASLLCSDLHAGAMVDNVFNYFDEDVLVERMEELVSKTIALCEKDNVTTLNFEMLGDAITGIIHGSTISEAQVDVIEQITFVSNVIANALVKLKEKIKVVNCYVVWGNHGRVSKGKSDFSNKTNFERFISTILKAKLSNFDIKVFDSANEDFLTYRINGNLIVCTHGSNDNPINDRKNFSDLLGEKVYEVHMGHFHEYKVSDGTIVNGSIMGSDEYAISIRKNSKPTQVLKVYLDEIKTTYEIELN